MDASSPSARPTTANRRALLITAAVFIMPVVVAYVLLKTGWYGSAGTSNRGLLINPPISFDELQLTDAGHQKIPADDFRRKWWIMYVMPSHCEAACRNSLYLMRQTHQALGPDKPRVAELIVVSGDLDAELAQWLAQEFPSARQVRAEAGNLDSVLSGSMPSGKRASEAGHLFLVDTMGAIFMHYPGHADERESILKGRDLLKDLQKVLKISKIG